MQKIIDKLINNSANTFEELKIKIINNPTFIVESDEGEIKWLFLDKGVKENRILYMYSNKDLKACRLRQFLEKLEIGEYKIIYEVNDAEI